jgi:hypothetical protein
MKISDKIFIGIIFSLALLFCSGIHLYFEDTFHHDQMEMTSGTQNTGNSFNSDIDSVDDDQINHTGEVHPMKEPDIKISPPTNNFPVHTFCLAVWQPPKIS